MGVGLWFRWSSHPSMCPDMTGNAITMPTPCTACSRCLSQRAGQGMGFISLCLNTEATQRQQPAQSVSKITLDDTLNNIPRLFPGCHLDR